MGSKSSVSFQVSEERKIVESVPVRVCSALYMGSCVHLIFLISVSFSIAGNLIGLTGYSWWTTQEYDHGLWRYSHTLSGNRGRYYYIRQDLLNSHGEYYITTLLLATSCVFIVASAICETLIYFDCIQRAQNKGIQIEEQCCGKLLFVVSIISMCFAHVCGFGALVYVERALENNFKIMTRGWSNVGCWLGYVVGAVLFTAGCVVSCVKRTSNGVFSIVQVEPYAGDSNNAPEVKSLFGTAGARKDSKQVRFKSQFL